MDPKTKKKIIIGLSVTTILGVAGYFLYQYIKDSQSGEGDSDGDSGVDQSITNTATLAPPSTGGSPPSQSNPGVADRPDDVLAFQKWANANGWTPKLDEDGLWGPKTKSAWNSKKASYNSSTGADMGQLTGQLKVIYDKFMATSSLKDNTKFIIGSKTAKPIVRTIGNTSGKWYYYYGGGAFYVYNKEKTKQIASGNYTNNGLTLVMTSGPGKGRTFTGTSILKVANEASSNPQATKTLSNNDVTDIVVKFYDAMKGMGTKDGTFLTNWKRMQTLADWSAVYHTFGTKDGENLWQWMKGESALQSPVRKAYFNKWFADRGSSNRF